MADFDFKAITTNGDLARFNGGYDATFGAKEENTPRTPRRTRYVCRNGKLVEQFGPEDTGAADTGEDARLRVVSDLYMDGVRATDGTDIGSRAKRREYMRVRGLADVSDYTNEWAQKAKVRERIARGEDPTGERRRTLGKVAYELSKKW